MKSFIIASLLVALSVSQLNPINPNFDYPEVNLVDTQAAGIPYAGQMHDGYIQVNNTTGSKIFYILYAAGGQNNAHATVNNSAPLILWLQGGPGCSDGAGLYLEIGPITVKNISGKLTPVQQPVNWNDEYNLLFVDSPVGVGFSVCGDEVPNNAMSTAEYLQIFLIRFFQVYTSLARNDFYIFGESFGGHYIPALASLITQNVTNNNIQLKGIGVGDGWTDPYIQVASYSDYCFSAGLLDEHERAFIAGLQNQAEAESKAGNPAGLSAFFDQITGNITELNNEIDIYNWQIYDLPSEFPYDEWLEEASVKEAYGVDPNVTYQDCVESTYYSFYPDIGTSYTQNYTYLLTQNNIPNLKVLLYSGQNDIICNTLGTMRYLTTLQWAGIPLFSVAQRQPLNNTENEIVGFFKNYQRLSFSLIYNAGHMLPWDQPTPARIMLQHFIDM